MKRRGGGLKTIAVESEVNSLKRKVVVVEKKATSQWVGEEGIHASRFRGKQLEEYSGSG